MDGENGTFSMKMLSVLRLRPRFSVDGKHFIRFRGVNAAGLVWMETLCVFKFIGISVDRALII